MNTDKITFHRDGSITFWNVYSQQWERTSRPTNEDIASMPEKHRDRVMRHIYDRSKERF